MTHAFTDRILGSDFLSEYKERPVPWGYGDLSYVTYKRTYARPIEGEDRTEEWWETCDRVINGMFSIQRAHCKRLGLPWSEDKAKRFAAKAYDRLFNFKWTPPGRGLWMMGSKAVIDGNAGAGLFNCSVCSTKDIEQDFARPFTWAFLMSMLGVGVGFDTKGAGKLKVQKPEREAYTYVIKDSREGWAEALGVLLNSFMGKAAIPQAWDYSQIRPKGAEIKTFGGVASGQEPLKEMLEKLQEVYMANVGKEVSSTLIVDTMNIVARCVVSGGVRRSAMLALGQADDPEFMELKQDQEKLMAWRWASNNSVESTVGMDYSELGKRTASNGEPGYVWLDTVKNYGRMKDGYQKGIDAAVVGVNPCVTGDTIIYTAEHGPCRIGDMVGRDDFDIAQYGGVYGPHKGVVSRGVKDVVKLDFDMALTLTCTPEHKIATTQGKVPAKDLTKTHEILMHPDFTPVIGETTKHFEGVYTTRLKSIEPAGQEEVFDVIATETTTFIANGLVISNCAEIGLENWELCNLTELYPAHHDTLPDFLESIRVAYQYSKTVTLTSTHDAQTNAVMLKNRRIGLSMSGIVQAVNKHGYRKFFEWCDVAYSYVQELDKKYSDWLCIPRSKKTTSVKPSGTVSLLSGATPGVHWGHSEYYIRRVRIRDTHNLIQLCKDAGYPVEPDSYAPNTMVVEFPVHVANMSRSKHDVPAAEKMELAAKLQHYWSDNLVSATIEFDTETEAQAIPRLLEMYEDRLKSISFLPMSDSGYVQMPYEEIDKEEYERRLIGLKPLSAKIERDQEDKFCSGTACLIEP